MTPLATLGMKKSLLPGRDLLRQNNAQEGAAKPERNRETEDKTNGMQ